MPSLCLHLPPSLAIVLRDQIDDSRKRAPQATVTPAGLVASIIREHLAARRQEQHRALLVELRRHPLRPKAQLPYALQDRVLAAIHQLNSPRDRLVGELIRAGAWPSQIAALARRWKQQGLAQDDLETAGMVGLMQAINRWRPGTGWRSYAYLWIKKELERCCRTGGALVMESEGEMRIRRTVERHARQGTTAEEIAQKTGLSAEQVERGQQGRRALDWKEIDGRTM